jgi:hypothetical protein
VNCKSACALALVAALAAGCATARKPEPTRYERALGPAGTGYGYRDTDLGSDEYSIFVAGNPITTKERAAEIALLRAARLARERGRTHFLILRRTSGDQEVFHAEIVPIFIGGMMTWIPVGEHGATEPMSVLLVRLLPLQRAYPRDAIDAAEAIARLAPSVD